MPDTFTVLLLTRSSGQLVELFKQIVIRFSWDFLCFAEIFEFCRLRDPLFVGILVHWCENLQSAFTASKSKNLNNCFGSSHRQSFVMEHLISFSFSFLIYSSICLFIYFFWLIMVSCNLSYRSPYSLI